MVVTFALMRSKGWASKIQNSHKIWREQDDKHVGYPQRKNIKVWWIGWYENGKRKAKALPTRTLAEHYRQIKYKQLNSDVFTGAVTADWAQMRQQYTHTRK